MKIRETKCIKYLGVIIDSKLNWIITLRMLKLKLCGDLGVCQKDTPITPIPSLKTDCKNHYVFR